MKKYTEKQIESFKEMINNGIISQIDGYPELCRKIVRDVHEIEEYKEYFPKMEINRKSMIKLLELRDYATKEDILNELKEIL